MNSRITPWLICLIVVCAGLPAARAQDSPHKVEIVSNSIGMKLSRIMPGTFQMGSAKSEPERRRDETAHEVTITKPFLIGVYEVSQSEFSRIMGTEAAKKAVFRGSKRPMDNATWESAGAFCQTLSLLPAERNAGRTYRLPTEADWMSLIHIRRSPRPTL